MSDAKSHYVGNGWLADRLIPVWARIGLRLQPILRAVPLVVLGIVVGGPFLVHFAMVAWMFTYHWPLSNPATAMVACLLPMMFSGTVVAAIDLVEKHRNQMHCYQQ